MSGNPWLPAAAPTTATLDCDRRADVVVIGAGYTGLSAALSLREAGADVVVLESGHAGAGASGCNSGHLTTSVGVPAKALLRSLGEDGARTFYRFCDEAVAATERRIREFHIDCDYVASGNLVASVHPSHDAKLESETLARRSLGARVSFVTGPQMRERGIPPAFRCGLLQEPGGLIDPGKYLRALRDAALAAGVRLFENSPLLAIRDGATVCAETARGVVTADALVLATNAFTPSLGRLERAVIPLRVCCIETASLSADERSAIGWAGGEGVSTTHAIAESYRWTARGGISASTRVVHYAWNSALSSSDDDTRHAVLERALRARFPVLASTRIAFRWGGWVAFTTDTLPLFGTTGPRGNVFHALGYSGHGIAQATLLGAMLAERVRGGRPALAAPFERKAWNWPVEPLRWIGARVVLGALESLDRRLDRNIAALGSSAS